MFTHHNDGGSHPKVQAWLQLGRLNSEDVTSLVKSAGVRILAIGINAGQSILLPIMVGPAIFGLFAGLYTNMSVGIGISRGPIELMIQRGHDHKSSIIYRRRSFQRVTWLGVLLAISIFLGLSALQRWELPLALYFSLSLAVWAGATSGLRRGLLISASRTSEVEYLDMVIRPALFLCFAGLFWVFGLVEPLLFWILGSSFIIALAWPNWQSAREFATIPEGNQSAISPWTALLTSNGLSILVKNADVIILGIFLDAATVGRFFIAARIADLAGFGYSFASSRFVHHFASARRNQRRDEMTRLIRRATMFGTGISALTAAMIFTLSPFVLPLIDPVLSEYLLPLGILVAGQVINGSLGVRGAFLTAVEPRYTLGTKLFLNPAAIGAMAFVVPLFGPIGAATVTTLFVFVMQLTNTLLLRKVLSNEARSVDTQSGKAA